MVVGKYVHISYTMILCLYFLSNYLAFSVYLYSTAKEKAHAKVMKEKLAMAVGKYVHIVPFFHSLECKLIISIFSLNPTVLKTVRALLT
jgi:hypothetical protein